MGILAQNDHFLPLKSMQTPIIVLHIVSLSMLLSMHLSHRLISIIVRSAKGEVGEERAPPTDLGCLRGLFIPFVFCPL